MLLWMVAVAVTMIVENAILSVTFGATPGLKLNVFVLTFISYGVSWVINMIYKSSRDTAIDEMGKIQLQVYHAAITEKLENMAATERTGYELALKKGSSK